MDIIKTIMLNRAIWETLIKVMKRNMTKTATLVAQEAKEQAAAKKELASTTKKEAAEKAWDPTGLRELRSPEFGNHF